MDTDRGRDLAEGILESSDRMPAEAALAREYVELLRAYERLRADNIEETHVQCPGCQGWFPELPHDDGELSFCGGCSEVDRLQKLVDRIKEHWIDGVSEDTEQENSWHGTMRDILDEAAEAPKERT